jgi:hypothetical protein
MAMPTGTDTMFFIPVHDIPKGKKVTYLKIITTYWPEKQIPIASSISLSVATISIILLVMSALLAKTANLPTVKTLLNSVISMPNTCFMTTDLKDFYLGTPLLHSMNTCKFPSQ